MFFQIFFLEVMRNHFRLEIFQNQSHISIRVDSNVKIELMIDFLGDLCLKFQFFIEVFI